MSDPREQAGRTNPEAEATIPFDPTIARPTTLSIARFFAKDGNTDFILETFQWMAGIVLSVDQLAKARETGLKAAAQRPLSLTDLVSVWDSVPELRLFARALLYGAVPGPHGEFGSRRDH